MPKLDFAPRFGFSYSVDPKTVIRAGYGINYAQFNREGGENLLAYNLPNIVNTNIVQTPQFALPAQFETPTPLAACTSAQASTAFDSTNPTPCFRTSSQGYPDGLTAVPTTAAQLSARDLITQARYIPKNLPTGYVQSFHLTVQRQLGPSTSLEASYVGEHGVKIQVLADLNQAAANPVTATCNATVTTGCVGPVQSRRPIATFTTIEESIPAGFLSYNSLQAKLEHRSGHGLYLLDSFTYSRAIDNAAGHLDTPDGDNSRVNLANIQGDRGVSAYNQPFNNIVSIVYDLPYGKGRMFGQQAPYALQQILGGWQFTAINSTSAGLPVNITYSPSTPQQLSGLLVYRPNQVPGARLVNPKSQRVRASNNTVLANTLNLAAFSVPDFNHPYGNAQRNSVRFDTFYQTDIGLHKSFALYPESVKFDFRAEAFNVFNQTNYAFPTSNISAGASGFGVVAAASTFPARILQFAGKIVF